MTSSIRLLNPVLPSVLALRSLALCLLVLLVLPADLHAHQVNVRRVDIAELGEGCYQLKYYASPGSPEASSRPLLPGGFEWVGEEPAIGLSGTVDVILRAPSGQLGPGDKLLFPWTRNGIVIHAIWKEHPATRHYFPAGVDGIVVDLGLLSVGSSSIGAAAGRFLPLGMEHILKGSDHLLFLVGVMLLIPSRRALLGAITAFTLAHSLSLALSVFNIIRIPSGSADLFVALSILFLAVEISRKHVGVNGLSVRAPWAVTFGFGLVHGLGFADALKVLGLSTSEIPSALLFFNLGIELGQLAFVAVCLATWWSLGVFQLKPRAKLLPFAALLLGTAAAFWFFECCFDLFTIL